MKGSNLPCYRAGDSLTFRLPDGTSIQLRELEVRPRKPNWHAVVGSLWFDTRTGQLVRAAYGLSEPMDMLSDELSRATTTTPDS